jgi:hypothetical protein
MTTEPLYRIVRVVKCESYPNGNIIDVPIYELVEPIESLDVWWCKTHGIGQHYDGWEPWWDEWTPYRCAIKAEYPVEGECVPVKVRVVSDGD